MPYEHISSTTNDKIKHAVKLSASSKFRRECACFLLEGLRLCRDAVLTGTEIETAFFTEEAFGRYAADLAFIAEKSEKVYTVSDRCAEKLSNTKSSQGVFCICRMPKEKTAEDIDTQGKYIVLENVRDPSNLGAVCRTAEALGISGAVVCGCCDIYNPKVQRAAMGSLLRLNIIKTEELAPLLLRLKDKGMAVYSTTPDPSAKKITEIVKGAGTLAVIGNEGNGVTRQTAAVCELVTIPMLGRAESLNASMAAAITMWEMMRG